MAVFLNGWVTLSLAVGLLVVPGCERQMNHTESGESSAPAAAQQPGTDKSSEKAAEGGTASFPYSQEIVATKLNVPWDMDFAPDGRIFLTERGGAIRVIDKGQLLEDPVYRFTSPLYNQGEAGLLGIALDKNFKSNHFLYVYHTYQEGGQVRNRVLRLVESGNKAKLDKVLLDLLPGERIHDGGRIKIGPDGDLYITSGDANKPSMAQDVKQLGGKILRIHTDGTIPKDNPFPGSPVYSLGHRNPQGLAWHPETGKLFSTEHGQTAHDEVNLIEPGANYGWPLIEGDASQIPAKDADKAGPGPIKKPILQSGDTTWAPSGITFVTKGPWKGSLLAANLRGMQLQRFILGSDQQSIVKVEERFKDELGRIRNVMEGPDGSLYILTNNRDGRGTPRPDDDKLIRFKPTF
ncbi:PQQ-dependent sugar dehydrogenase [Paenibacillus sp. UNC451MF]|uniref:PQQ-dependent sugar dehydrogenase n=1 Tax=Paenibacillus sp. UNC451MF TaxID=1449063 RepID=UPI000565A5AF|nr:PQQ-dependent sugar dehydrogenase [Paenibacillus sp. UNC451MF]